MPLPIDRFKPRTILYVSIDEDLKMILQKLADDNRRSLSSTVSIVLEKGLGLNPIQSLYMREDDSN